MQELVLSRCGIEDIRPNTFADLVNLRRLDLRFNRIVALSPSTFRGPVGLEYLLLSNNPIAELGDRSLQGLSAQRLVFSDSPSLVNLVSPTAFADSTVVSLVFARCNLTRVAARVWSSGTALKELEIVDNLQPLNLDADAFVGLQLRRLLLVNDGLVSTEFLQSGDFDEIELDGNPLKTITVDPRVGDANTTRSPRLLTTKILSLEGMAMSDLDSNQFSSFPDLEDLDLSGNGISGIVDVRTVFSGLDVLVRLDLSDNHIEGFAVKDEADLAPMFPQLENLALDGNRLRTFAEPSFGSLFRRLKNLTLANNPLHCNCELRWLADWIATPECPPDVRDDNPTLPCHTPPGNDTDQQPDFQVGEP